MRMGALGFRSALFPMAHQIGYDLAVKGDVMVVEIEADEVRDKLLPVDTNTNRFRLLLEGSREYKLGRGASLTPSLAMGVRYDNGDAEEGGGIELGGGFRFFDPSLDMVIDVNARGLLLHEESRFSEMGVSGSVHFTWGRRKKGLSVRVGSSWGDATSGAERLWSQASAASLASDAQNSRRALRCRGGLRNGRARRRPLPALRRPFARRQWIRDLPLGRPSASRRLHEPEARRRPSRASGRQILSRTRPARLYSLVGNRAAKQVRPCIR